MASDTLMLACKARDICNNQDQLGGLTERLGLPANDFADVSSIEIGF